MIPIAGCTLVGTTCKTFTIHLQSVMSDEQSVNVLLCRKPQMQRRDAWFLHIHAAADLHIDAGFCEAHHLKQSKCG